LPPTGNRKEQAAEWRHALRLRLRLGLGGRLRGRPAEKGYDETVHHEKICTKN